MTDMQTSEKKNIAWINTARAIAMFFIFFGHCQNYWGFDFFQLSTYTSPFKVSIFFFISGYLLFGKHLLTPIADMGLKEYASVSRKQMKNIFFKMVIPALLFSIVEFFPANLIRGKGFTGWDFVAKTLGGCTYWFVSALVIAEILACALLLTRIRFVWFYFGCSCLLTAAGCCLVYSGFVLWDVNGGFPWMYKQGMLCMAIFALGGVYRKYEAKIQKVTDSLYFLLPATIGYVVLLTLLPDAFRSTISTLDVNLPGYGITILGVLIFVGFCKLIPSVGIVQSVGKNTIGYYFLCGSVPAVLAKVLAMVLPKQTFVGFAIMVLFSFPIASGVVYILNRFFPFVFDLRLLIKRKEQQ